MQRENSSNTLLKHTLLFSLFVFLAQVLGLVRDLFLTRYFGVGYILDTYYLAFKVPDFLNIFYAVFLGSVVFIPLLTAAKNKGEESEILKIVRSIGSLVFYLVILIGVLLFIFMPWISAILAPTWSLQQQELHTSLSRILLIAQFFFPIGILAGSIGMIYNKPYYMAASGFIYNLFILLGVVIFGKIFGIYGAIGGVLVGSVAFMLVQIIPVEVRNIFKQFRFEFVWTEWLLFLKANMMRFFAVLAYQLFGVILLYIATFSGSGGVSVFSISYNLYLALFFILGASLSTAAMPNIARLHVTGDKEQQKENLNNSLTYMFFVGCFITLFGYIFSLDMVKILYFFSHIGEEKEILIATVFALLILALPFFNLLEIIRKYLYSTNQIYLASGLTILMLATVLVFSFVFEKVFSYAILPSLALAILAANILSLIFALFILNKKKQIGLREIIKNSYKVLLLSLLSFVTFHFVFNFIFNLIGIYSSNYFIELFFRGIILFIIFISYTLVFNDSVGKNILRQISKFVV